MAVPGVRMVLTYRAAWLPKDLVAGLVLTALLVPQGMAYAELAGLPADHRPLHVGPLPDRLRDLRARRGSSCSARTRRSGPMIAATILPLVGANGDPQRASSWRRCWRCSSARSRCSAGSLRLGFVADLLSKPTMIGYMNGLALTILVGQLPKLFGFSIDADGFIDELKGFVNGVADGETIAAALASGLFGLVTILVLTRVLPKIPGVLAAVVLSIARDDDLRARASTACRSSARCRRDCRRSRFRGWSSPTCRLLVGGALGHRSRHPGRHDRDRLGVCHSHRPGVRRRSGDDRHRRREHRRRALPGLPRQHERVADRRRRAVGREDPGDRPRRGASRSS